MRKSLVEMWTNFQLPTAMENVKNLSNFPTVCFERDFWTAFFSLFLILFVLFFFDLLLFRHSTEQRRKWKVSIIMSNCAANYLFIDRPSRPCVCHFRLFFSSTRGVINRTVVSFHCRIGKKIQTNVCRDARSHVTLSRVSHSVTHKIQNSLWIWTTWKAFLVSHGSECLRDAHASVFRRRIHHRQCVDRRQTFHQIHNFFFIIFQLAVDSVRQSHRNHSTHRKHISVCGIFLLLCLFF